MRVDSLKGVILPPKILTIVRKLSSGEGSLSLALTDKNVFMRIGATRLSSTSSTDSSLTIDGLFPTTRSTGPRSKRKRWKTPCAGCRSSWSRSPGRSCFTLSYGAMTVISKESELGMATEELLANTTGPDGACRNCLYIREPLREISSEKVTLEFSDVNKAITLRPVPERATRTSSCLCSWIDSASALEQLPGWALRRLRVSNFRNLVDGELPGRPRGLPDRRTARAKPICWRPSTCSAWAPPFVRSARRPFCTSPGHRVSAADTGPGFRGLLPFCGSNGPKEGAAR